MPGDRSMLPSLVTWPRLGTEASGESASADALPSIDRSASTLLCSGPVMLAVTGPSTSTFRRCVTSEFEEPSLSVACRRKIHVPAAASETESPAPYWKPRPSATPAATGAWISFQSWVTVPPSGSSGVVLLAVIVGRLRSEKVGLVERDGGRQVAHLNRDLGSVFVVARGDSRFRSTSPRWRRMPRSRCFPGRIRWS